MVYIYMGMSSFLDNQIFPLLPKGEYIRQVLSFFYYIVYAMSSFSDVRET
jgi:hypothetical protein